MSVVVMFLTLSLPVDKEGRTPLHYAVEEKIQTPIIVKMVKECSDALYIPDKSGKTPLHLGKSLHHPDVSLLLFAFLFKSFVLCVSHGASQLTSVLCQSWRFSTHLCVVCQS